MVPGLALAGKLGRGEERDVDRAPQRLLGLAQGRRQLPEAQVAGEITQVPAAVRLQEGGREDELPGPREERVEGSGCTHCAQDYTQIAYSARPALSPSDFPTIERWQAVKRLATASLSLFGT